MIVVASLMAHDNAHSRQFEGEHWFNRDSQSHLKVVALKLFADKAYARQIVDLIFVLGQNSACVNG